MIRFITGSNGKGYVLTIATVHVQNREFLSDEQL